MARWVVASLGADPLLGRRCATPPEVGARESGNANIVNKPTQRVQAVRGNKCIEAEPACIVVVDSKHARGRPIQLADDEVTIDGEAGDRHEVIEFHLPPQRRLELGARLAQFFGLQVHFNLVHLQLVQHGEGICGRVR